VCLLGRFPALAGVDLDIDEGEVVLVSGPNGAGKTTLLRLLAGLVPLSGGTGQVLGHNLGNDRLGARRHVALLGHAPGCYEDLSVRENLRFFARAAGGRAADADVALERLALGRLAGLAFHRLSAGQRRRVALAVLVARRPRLVLLDEPHAELDSAGRDLLDGLVHSLSAEGATVLLSSHELARARSLTGREVTLVAGRVRAARPEPSPASPGSPARP
jgi:heme ABC exporter ATP-binding subunit CcmA